MIPSAREIQSALYGAWTLFKLDPRGLEFFEDSIPAFWRSFFAAVIVFPGFAILRVVDMAESEVSAGTLATLPIELIAYVVIWAGFPLALHYLCRGLGRDERFLRTVIALNWSEVIQMVLTLPVHLIAASGILSPGFATLAVFAVVLVTLFYEGFVARTALEVTPPLAALVVGIHVAIVIAAQALVKGMLA